MIPTSAQLSAVEPTSLSERSQQLQSCIYQLQNRRVAKGVLNPDDAELLDGCIKELAAIKRQLE